MDTFKVKGKEAVNKNTSYKVTPQVKIKPRTKNNDHEDDNDTKAKKFKNQPTKNLKRAKESRLLITTPEFSAGHRWTASFMKRHMNVECIQQRKLPGDWC